MALLEGILAALIAAGPAARSGPAPGAGPDARFVRGMTISCQTWGREWASDGFARELDELARLGVNWVAIHPYARIGADGTVSWRALDPEDPPEWIARPIREAHARGMSILVIPHLAYWGSPWRWRGDIDFEDPAALDRFFATSTAWLVAVARASRGADAFCVGNETDRLIAHESHWRDLIGAVRAATDAKLVYASNWSDYARVPFWDALDAIGVQGYFPLSEASEPAEDELRGRWRAVLAELRALSERTGKPVVFTELGYPASLEAARMPWAFEEARGAGRAAAEDLQRRLLAVALDEIGREREWLRGAFLWKWFVGPAPGENFLMNRPPLREVIAGAWGAR